MFSNKYTEKTKIKAKNKAKALNIKQIKTKAREEIKPLNDLFIGLALHFYLEKKY